MALGEHNISVDHQVLNKAAEDINKYRTELADILYAVHNEMDEVGNAMGTRAGEKLIDRFNNLVGLYFDRYVDTMAEHAVYLNQAAIDYEAADDSMKTKAEDALANFDHV